MRLLSLGWVEVETPSGYSPPILSNSSVAEAVHGKPDAAILIDFPYSNLRLARELHCWGYRVFYFVSHKYGHGAPDAFSRSGNMSVR